ncbi:hypothetical protein B5U27_22525 [Pseudomonas amygdali pv. lachrymans]|nr:hypothetical protein B5U27_22525 [Pseudomonas amygdali pv. lachrymans]
MTLSDVCATVTGNDHLNYRAALRVACRSGRLRVLLTTQSVETCIPTLERAERSSQLSYDHLEYRAALRVACRSGRSASS